MSQHPSTPIPLAPMRVAHTYIYSRSHPEQKFPIMDLTQSHPEYILFLEVMDMNRWRSRVSMEHLVEDGCFKFQIWIPDDMVPYNSMKNHILSSSNSRLAIVEYLREHIEKEAIWSSCPDWEMDYGICSSPWR